MKELNAWVPWFGELCEKIVEGGESELARRAHEVQWTQEGNVPPLLQYGDDNIDPFSFLYRLAAGVNSAEWLFADVGNVFNLAAEVPFDVNDAWMIPKPPYNVTLFHSQGRGNPSLLWRLFHSAREGTDAVDGADFDGALEIVNVGIAKLTQTLFLINPSEFIPYDNMARTLLEDDDPDASDWEGYRSVIDRFHDAFPGCGFDEVNAFAWFLQSERISLGSTAWQISTDVYGDGEDRWKEFVEANAVWTGGPGGATSWPDYEAGIPPSHPYPLESPEPGDLVLVRYGKQGRGIGVVYGNGYQKDMSKDARLDVVWVNRSAADVGSFGQTRGFSHAHDIADAFFGCDAYAPTFRCLAALGEKREATEDEGAEEQSYDVEVEELVAVRFRPEETGDDVDGAPKYIWYLGEVMRILDGGETLIVRFFSDGEEYWISDTPRMATYDRSGHPMRTLSVSKIEKLAEEEPEGGWDPESPEPWETAKVDRVADDKQNERRAVAPRNQILYGPPGTGKTWDTVNLALSIVEGGSGEHDVERFNELRFDADKGKGNIALVTFHQNFAYEDFIEGIRPVLAEGELPKRELLYELHEGVFKRLANAALERRDERFVLIVDEINRGNVARIFGELITLIEDSRRIGEDEQTFATLPYSGEKFGVPGNLYLVGTMNTADRSIQLLDTALRRRFTFLERMPNPDHKGIGDVEGVDCRCLLRTLNERIAVLLDREHQIGHTYFLNLRNLEDLADVFQNRIFPLLQQYFFDDWSKVRAVLGNNAFVREQPVEGLFSDSDLVDGDRKIYERLTDQHERWHSADEYRKIYGGANRSESDEDG